MADRGERALWCPVNCGDVVYLRSRAARVNDETVMMRQLSWGIGLQVVDAAGTTSLQPQLECWLKEIEAVADGMNHRSAHAACFVLIWWIASQDVSVFLVSPSMIAFICRAGSVFMHTLCRVR